jgi:hypothetical protein
VGADKATTAAAKNSLAVDRIMATLLDGCQPLGA